MGGFLEHAWCIYVREVIKVLHAGSGFHYHSVYFIMEPIQEKPQELLSILLTTRQKTEGKENIFLSEFQLIQNDILKNVSIIQNVLL